MRYCLFAVLTLLSTACAVDRSSHGGNKATCAEGREGCACYGNKTCDGALTCVSDVCVDLGGAAGSGATGGAGSAATAGSSAAGAQSDEDGSVVEPDGGVVAEDSGTDAAVATFAHTLLVGVWSVTGGCPPVPGRAPETWTIDADYTVAGVKSQGWFGDVLYGAGDAMFHLTGHDSWEGTMSYLNVQTMMPQHCTYTAIRKQ